MKGALIGEEGRQRRGKRTTDFVWSREALLVSFRRIWYREWEVRVEWTSIVEDYRDLLRDMVSGREDEEICAAIAKTSSR